MKIRRFVPVLVLILLAACCTPAMAGSVYYGTMMVDHCDEWVSLRDGPGRGCGRIAQVPLYALVTGAEWDPLWGDFIYCNYDGQSGYILSQYLVPWADPEPDPEGEYVSDLGFAFRYDASVLTVDSDLSEDGQSLIVFPTDSDVSA